MIYSEETFLGVIADIVPLLTRHWDEIALNKETVPLAPDYAQYQRLNDQGILNIYTARNDNGVLVGYCLTITVPHIHYSTTISSNVDLVYVVPEHRGKMTGVRLMQFTEDSLKEKGVKLLSHHVKEAHDFSAILLRKGYKKAETIYGKYLGDK